MNVLVDISESIKPHQAPSYLMWIHSLCTLPNPF